ncbi:MAG: acyl carrier protein [Hyphomicrobiales bacterium]|nr:acyl carrier protein [Hyphomicrobiales bacterium]
MSWKGTILKEIHVVAAEQNRTLAPLTEELRLNESGLDSLCFAILVSRLEDSTGLDPLSTIGSARFPSTLGDLIALYEEAQPTGVE